MARFTASCAALLVALLSGTTGKAETLQIVIEQLEFRPAQSVVQVGDTIEWINKDVVAHTATARNGGWEVVSSRTDETNAGGKGWGVRLLLPLSPEHDGSAKDAMTCCRVLLPKLDDLRGAAWRSSRRDDRASWRRSARAKRS